MLDPRSVPLCGKSGDGSEGGACNKLKACGNGLDEEGK